MTELPLIFWGIILTLFLFCIKSGIVFFKWRRFDFASKINLIINNLSDFKPILIIMSGFSIITGINFILQAISKEYPIILQIEESQVYIFFIGGLAVILVSIYATFDDEFTALRKTNLPISGKMEINIEGVKVFHEYTRYKEKTSNPDLLVISFIDEETILVNTTDVRNYITENLFFNLKILESFIINGQSISVPSLDIAECQMYSSGSRFTYFKIKKWINTSQYEEQIEKLKRNEDIDNLKPIITLRNNILADRYSYDEIDSLQKTIQKFMTNLEER